MTKNRFFKIVESVMPKENLTKSLILAFIMGGLMGIINQGLIDIGINLMKLSKDDAPLFSSLVIVTISFFLTYFSFYGKLGQIFGAGLFVPISGFANSMASSFIEGKSEGLVMGVGNKAFSLAGSVIIYGVGSGLIIAILNFLINLIGGLL